IHSDGRLIAHHSRKFREEIDEDIFSGMLTVVQDFVKDSFKSRSRVGMKRLDFGDSKILIERSPHTFLATVVFGQEPKLLPLYMLQVLKEVEDRYGTVLERWTGLLHQLDGVDDVIKKLVLVAKDPSADIGALADSPITLTAKVIEALGTNEAIEANELMAKAQSTLETDIQLAWQFIEKARGQAQQIEGAIQKKNHRQMEDYLRRAKESLARQRRSTVLDKARESLAKLQAMVSQAKAVHADLGDVEALLAKAEDAFRQEDLRGLEGLIERAE